MGLYQNFVQTLLDEKNLQTLYLIFASFTRYETPKSVK